MSGYCSLNCRFAPISFEKVCELAAAGEASFSSLELDLIGCNHLKLGGALAVKWGFPDFCRAAAAYHHMPALADPEHQQLVSLIYVADTLCCDDAIGFDLTAKGQFTDTAAGNDQVPQASSNMPGRICQIL